MSNEVIKVFKINDCDWWAGRNAEETLAAYMAETGTDKEEATGGDESFPHELSEREMETMMFTPDPDDGEGTEPIPFREVLDRMIARGGPFPSFFASTEY